MNVQPKKPSIKGPAEWFTGAQPPPSRATDRHSGKQLDLEIAVPARLRDGRP